MEVPVELVGHLIPIWEFLASGTGLQSGYPTWCFSWFSLCRRQKSNYYLRLFHDPSFPRHFIIH